MIEKLDVINSGINVIDRFGFTQNVPVARIYCNKINEIIDIINAITIDVDGTKCVDGSKAPADNSEKANCPKNVQPDYVATAYMTDGHTKKYYGQNGASIVTDRPLPAGYVIAINEPETKGGDNE